MLREHWKEILWYIYVTIFVNRATKCFDSQIPVLKDVPSGAVMAVNPAKFIRVQNTKS